MTRTATCARCNRRRSIRARSLCQNCHDAARDTGRLAEYPTRAEANAARNARIVAELRDGRTISAIAADLGTSYDTVRSVARVHGLIEAGGIRNGATPVGWLRDIAPAPTPTPCTGEVMDFDGMKPYELTPERNAAVAFGLSLCASCPLATKRWCLDLMDPTGHGREWQGLAGGVVWSHGKAVYGETRAVA